MSDPSAQQATQLRFAFASTAPQRIHIDVAGLTLLVNADCAESELFTFLAERGLEPEYRPGIGVSLPARHLAALGALDVVCVPSDALRPLWYLAANSPPPEFPATVVRSNGAHLLSWESQDGVPYDEMLSPTVSVLLGFVDLPIVATDDVWVEIERSLPTLGPSGTATWHPDGYITISTSKPQVLESSTLPGLFRTSATSFGVCAAYAEDVADENGIRWVGTRPIRRRSALAVPSHLALAPHIRTDLTELVEGLNLLGSKAIVWESGLGRRVLALAALEVLDAYPATVLCAPQSIWLWRRHVEMVARTCGLLSAHNDVQLVTYHDLQFRRIEPQAIVFDDLASQEAAAAWPALRSLQHLSDTLRVAIEDEWPIDGETQRKLMEVLRPAEFRTDLPLAERYPVDPLRRLNEHVEVYLARRTRHETPELLAFRRSSVRTVTLSAAQEAALAGLGVKAAVWSPAQSLAETLELVSAGPANAVSPKLAAAAEIARNVVARGRTVAIVTRHRRAAQLLRAMLRPASVSHVEAPSPLTDVPRVPVAVIRFEHSLPNLTAFDDVVVLDYPWSLDVLDRGVGHSTEPDGPDVVVIHAAGSVDDRLAVLAARRSELGDTTDATRPPSDQEIAYLLTPR